MTPAQKLTEEKEVVRKIQKEINNFGINEHQRLFLIYVLALELESVEARQDLSIVSKELLEQLKFNIATDDETTND